MVNRRIPSRYEDLYNNTTPNFKKEKEKKKREQKGWTLFLLIHKVGTSYLASNMQISLLHSYKCHALSFILLLKASLFYFP